MDPDKTEVNARYVHEVTVWANIASMTRVPRINIEFGSGVSRRVATQKRH